MKVKKRNGNIVEFQKNKIVIAILKAMREVGEVDKNLALQIADNVEKEINDLATIDQIQDIVENNLMELGSYKLAKAYITYRYLHDTARENYQKVINIIQEKGSARNVQNQNANVDEASFGGRKGETIDEILKDYALNHCMCKKSRDHHLNNEIYQHDLSSYYLGLHNCLSMPLDDLLANGFVTRQVDIRPANSVNTAMQLVAVLFQIQSLQMFGGVAATHLDWTMVPYVRKSFNKHYRDGMKYVENKLYEDNILDVSEVSIEDNLYKQNDKAYEYAMNMTIKEVNQATEGLFHNLNSLQSRSGNQLN